MKTTVHIDPTREEELIIYAHEKSELVDRLVALAKEEAEGLVGYRDRAFRPLDPATVDCFVAEEGKVFALTEEGRWQLQMRLYRVEQMLGDRFVKINQSCLANVRRIKRFDVSIGGALMVSFACGHRDFVSRRQLKTVKERIGFRL